MDDGHDDKYCHGPAPSGSYEAGFVAAVRAVDAEESPVPLSEWTEGLDHVFVRAWAELGFTLDSEGTPEEGSEKRDSSITVDDADVWAKAALSALTDVSRETTSESLADLARETADRVESFIAQTLLGDGDETPGVELGRNAMAGYVNGVTNTLMVATLMRWLTAARNSGAVDSSAVLAWVNGSLDWPHNFHAERAAAIIGHPVDEVETPAEMHQLFDPMFATVMIWLAAGIVATVADGDAHWLRQFDGPWQRGSASG